MFKTIPSSSVKSDLVKQLQLYLTANGEKRATYAANIKRIERDLCRSGVILRPVFLPAARLGGDSKGIKAELQTRGVIEVVEWLCEVIALNKSGCVQYYDSLQDIASAGCGLIRYIDTIIEYGYTCPLDDAHKNLVGMLVI